LRCHSESVKALRKGVAFLRWKDGVHSSYNPENVDRFYERLEHIEEYLEHHQLTSETTLNSMENLLSLVSPLVLVDTILMFHVRFC
jgi:hypothetical protein